MKEKNNQEKSPLKKNYEMINAQFPPLHIKADCTRYMLIAKGETHNLAGCHV